MEERGERWRQCRRRLLAMFFAWAVFFGAGGSADAAPGVSDDEIVLGMVNSLSGPASALGTGIKKGALVYFDKVNAAGGIHGRKIRVISYDDGYEPRETFTMTEKLIREDRVFALFGYVGTPTARAIIPLINREKIIFFAPFTGAEFLRNPVNRYIFNVRASYFDEAEAQIDYLTGKMRIDRVGIFLQNDSYGLAVKGGIHRALRLRKLAIHGEGTYPRNTEEVEAGLTEIRKADPQAVSMVGTYRAMAAFIKRARKTQFDPLFLNVSFVGTAALIRELGEAGEGVLVTQVMPAPDDPSLPLVAQYQKDMEAAGYREFDYTDLEGYVNAMVFSEILGRVGPDLSRESFVQAAEQLEVNLGGLAFNYSPTDHQALKAVYMTLISGGRAVPVQ